MKIVRTTLAWFFLCLAFLCFLIYLGNKKMISVNFATISAGLIAALGTIPITLLKCPQCKKPLFDMGWYFLPNVPVFLGVLITGKMSCRKCGEKLA